jgi:hypothetical protein
MREVLRFDRDAVVSEVGRASNDHPSFMIYRTEHSCEML